MKPSQKFGAVQDKDELGRDKTIKDITRWLETPEDGPTQPETNRNYTREPQTNQDGYEDLRLFQTVEAV